MPDKKIAIPEEIRNRFRGFVTSRSGLYFRDHDLKDLENVISERTEACGFDSPVSYYSYLTTSDKREDELRELLNRLTINHTYFFRNEQQFEALKKEVLPEIFERKARAAVPGAEKPKLKVWSAGCSTGEEAYSIAMIVDDMIGGDPSWDVQIIATDASTGALEKAHRGAYSKNSVKSVTAPYMRKYFTEKVVHGGRTEYMLSDDIKKMVSFVFHNLIEDDFPAGFDVIFCRNVVIYFEMDTTVRIMDKFYKSLEDGGYLFAGYSESLYFMQDKFRMVTAEDAIYYRKISEARREEPAARRGRDAPPKEKTISELLDELSRAELSADIKAESGAALPPTKKIEDILVEALKSFHMKEYGRALLYVNDVLDINANLVDPYYLAAEIYVNQGRFDEAKKMLSSAIRINPLFAPAHYLFGCVFMEEGTLDKAKESLRKAVYIDKDFSIARFYLAHVYKSEGRPAEAIREYRNTIKLLSNSKADDILPYGGGFNVATLANACRENIERLNMGIS